MFKKVGLFMIIIMFFIPSGVDAVEFSITDMTIDAYLQENGNIEVTEKHSYSFDGKFNGITREIFPKKNAEINHFIAKEGDKSLKVEKEGHLYKVHRKGKSENIKVNIHYSIENGMEKYSDVAEFYWPFFDQRNAADYGRVTIVIHPPQPTDEAIAMGYDSAFNTENVENEGSVVFSLGKVDAGENGDIRVAYDANLFPLLSTTANKEMKQEILNEKQTMKAEAKEFEENKSKTALIGMWSLLGITALFISTAVLERKKFRNKKQIVKKKVSQAKVQIPKQLLSMPATIYFTHPSNTEPIAAALMDLVRKGYINQTNEGQFMLINREASEEHEKILINLLFDKIGWNGAFSMNDLEEFMEDKKNHLKYNEAIIRWKTAVNQEIKKHGLYDNRKKVRAAIGLSSLLPLMLGIVSAKYELYLMMAISFLLWVVYLIFSIFYKRISEKGLIIKEEWSRLDEEFDQISDKEWDQFREEERMRAMIYSLGINSPVSRRINQSSSWEGTNDTESTAFGGFYPFAWPMLASQFETAGKKAQNTVDASHTANSTSSGGGVGGGGGGSGAF